jgi:hypothetical protein
MHIRLIAMVGSLDLCGASRLNEGGLFDFLYPLINVINLKQVVCSKVYFGAGGRMTVHPRQKGFCCPWQIGDVRVNACRFEFVCWTLLRATVLTPHVISQPSRSSLNDQSSCSRFPADEAIIR